MSDLRELYQEVILDHYRKPRNFHRMEDAHLHAEGHNPVCGDNITVYLKMDGEAVKDVSFEGAGCAICTASASLMTESVKGKTSRDVIELFNKFHLLLTSESDRPPTNLGKLEVFSGVREFPIRVKCATLAWHTLRAAIEKRNDQVTTE